MKRLIAFCLAAALTVLAYGAEHVADAREFTGVVTWVDPWWGFCLQAEDIAFFVEGRSRGEIRPGTVVEAMGEPRFHGRGGDLRRTRFTVRGMADLPPPRPCTMEEILESARRMPNGMSDFYGLRVTVEGVLVHADEARAGTSVLVLGDTAGTLTVRMKGGLPEGLQALRDSRPTVRVTGPCLMLFAEEEDPEPMTRRLEVEVLVTGPEDIVVVEDANLARIRSRQTVGLLLRAVGAITVLALVFLLVKLLVTRAKLRRLEAVAAERRRLSADMHDGIEQYFAGVNLVLGTALELCPETPRPVAAAIDESSKILAQAKAELRAMIWNLRNESWLARKPAEVLAEQADALTAKGVVRVVHDLAALPEKLPEGMLANLVCIVQESMTNAVKHGHARRMTLKAARAGAGWSLTLANDGETFDPQTALGPETGHFGLAGIAHRAHHVGLKATWSADGRVLSLVARVLVVLLGISASASGFADVKVEGSPGAWQLVRDGRPFFIEGAGGNGDRARLKAIGGNAVRTWSADRIDEDLADAAQNDLAVMCGFWLGSAEHGFDWTDAAALEKSEAEVLRTVRRVKDHPALLGWMLGNELERNNPQRRLTWAFVDALAAKVKAEDPNHPVCTSVAEMGEETLRDFAACTNLDFLGINAYGGASTLGMRWRSAGMTRPYVVTEFGARGAWEGPRDAEGLPIEPTSTKKQEMFAAALRGIAAERGGCCLGSFAFAWGWKVEATPTWHGMLLPDQSRLGAVEACQEAWGRVPVGNRCPVIGTIKTSGSYFDSNRGVLTAWTEAWDADGDRLTWKWELVADTLDYYSNGTGLPTPTAFPSAILSGQGTSSVVVKLPGGGTYRLYAYVRDGCGNAAYANVAVRAFGDQPESRLPESSLPVAVYRDGLAPVWFASGYMGDHDALKVDEMCRESPHEGATCIRVEYVSTNGWAGLCWQDPANDWGEKPGGRNLSKARELSFWARGARGGERVTFSMGGFARGKKYCDTAEAELKDVALNKDWTHYRLNLEGLDLTRVKTGFAFVLAASNAPIAFYIDDVEYKSSPSP